jgi:4-hydroxy-4-methyl-2-oxoglutarate aldolase
MPSDHDDLIERLAHLETGLISDVLDESGYPDQVLSSELIPLNAGIKIAGYASCARGVSIVNVRSPVPSLPADTLERLARGSHIIVIESGRFTAGSCLGGFVAMSLKREGCRGVIVDAPVRDADEIRQIGLPVFSTGVNPINGARRWQLRETDCPVHLAGQTGPTIMVTPGDLILADSEGIIVIPQSIALSTIEDAEELQRIEHRIGEGIKTGGARAEVFAANPRFAHIRRHR